ncbi:MAG: hypothetical protein AAFQ42_01705 [Pseudomonadota bacterium]
MRGNIHIVVACSPDVGRGHLSRSLVLFDAFVASGHRPILYLDHDMGRRLADPRASRMRSALDARPGDLVVVDDYAVALDWLSNLRDRGAHIAVFDDLAEEPAPADTIVNHNFYGTPALYDVRLRDRILAGPIYALVSPHLATLAATPYRADGPILVSFGGSAAAVGGIDVAHALHASTGREIDLVLPSSLGRHAVGTSVAIRTHVDVDMGPLLARASLFVGAMGVVYLEALAIRCPTVGVRFADNQHLAYDHARSLGWAVVPDVGAIEQITEHAIQVLERRQRGPDLGIKGCGGARLAQVLLARCSPPPITA